MSESTKKKFYQTDGFRMFMGKYGIGVILIFMILVIGVMKPRFLLSQQHPERINTDFR